MFAKYVKMKNAHSVIIADDSYGATEYHSSGVFCKLSTWPVSSPVIFLKVKYIIIVFDSSRRHSIVLRSSWSLSAPGRGVIFIPFHFQCVDI